MRMSSLVLQKKIWLLAEKPYGVCDLPTSLLKHFVPEPCLHGLSVRSGAPGTFLELKYDQSIRECDNVVGKLELRPARRLKLILAERILGEEEMAV
jgi:hypothetical protein